METQEEKCGQKTEEVWTLNWKRMNLRENSYGDITLFTGRSLNVKKFSGTNQKSSELLYSKEEQSWLEGERCPSPGLGEEGCWRRSGRVEEGGRGAVDQVLGPE